MKITGLVAGLVGSIAAVLLWLIPASYSLLGSDVDCGIPIVTSFTGLADGATLTDEFLAGIDQRCRRESVIRAFTGLVVGTLGVGGGAIMVLLGSRRQETGMVPAAGLQWDGRQWVTRL